MEKNHVLNQSLAQLICAYSINQSINQSITQLTWCPGNRSFGFGIILSVNIGDVVTSHHTGSAAFACLTVITSPECSIQLYSIGVWRCGLSAGLFSPVGRCEKDWRLNRDHGLRLRKRCKQWQLQANFTHQVTSFELYATPEQTWQEHSSNS